MIFRYLLILIILFPVKAFSLIEVDITRGNLSPLPVAVSPLSVDSESKESFEKLLKKKNIGAEISLVVENNLVKSGLFNPLDKDAFLQNPNIAHLKPRFEDWALIKAQALITGKVTLVDEKLRVEFRLWDVLAGKEMMALAFTTVPNNWRRVGHIITDKVYERLTGEKGYFDTRIIYVAEEGKKTNRIKTAKTLTTVYNPSDGVIKSIDLASFENSLIKYFCHGGTTVINSITERKGSITALLTTKGFRDVLEIGRGNRPDLYNLHTKNPTPFVPRYLRFEIDERIDANGKVIRKLNLKDLDKIIKLLKKNKVDCFREKSSLDEGWINGGFFVMEPEFLKFIKNDNTYLEREPLEKVTEKRQLAAFRYKGFWHCIDTKRDIDKLNKILSNKKIKF